MTEYNIILYKKAQLMLTDPCDVFTDLSRSPKIDQVWLFD